jgi:hypothetical protein
MQLEDACRSRFAVAVLRLTLVAACGVSTLLCQRANIEKLPGPCRAALASKEGVASQGAQVFVRSLDMSKACSKAMHGGTSVRWTVREDGSIEKVEMLKGSKCHSWDEEVMAKAKTRQFPEAKVCGRFVVEVVAAPDLFTK